MRYSQHNRHHCKLSSILLAFLLCHVIFTFIGRSSSNHYGSSIPTLITIVSAFLEPYSFHTKRRKQSLIYPTSIFKSSSSGIRRKHHSYVLQLLQNEEREKNEDASTKRNIKNISTINRRSYITNSLSTSIAGSTITTLILQNDFAYAIEKKSYSFSINTSSLTTTTKEAKIIRLPLEPRYGGVLSVRATIMGNDITSSDNTNNDKSIAVQPYRIYRLIIDTGSPYLVLPSIQNDEDVLSSGYIPLDTSIDTMNLGWYSNLKVFLENVVDLFKKEEEDVDFELSRSMYQPTQEIYGSVSGYIDWKNAGIKFRDARLSPTSATPVNKELTSDEGKNKKKVGVGVMDENLTMESGGALLGLVKRSNANTNKIDIRPTVLEQERIVTSTTTYNNNDGEEVEEEKEEEEEEMRSFTIDAPNRILTLSTQSLLPTDNDDDEKKNVVPLVDLRPLGDFVEHYACIVQEIMINDSISISELDLESVPLRHDWQKSFIGGSKKNNNNETKTKRTSRKIVAVFDTGLTGCLLTQPFWDELSGDKMNNLDPNGFQSVKVKIRTIDDNSSSNDGKYYTKNTDQKKKQKTEKSSSNNNNSSSSSRVNKSSSSNLFTIESSIKESKLFYVKPISLDWFDDEETAPHVIVLGQTFLGRGALTIDIDDRKAFFASKM